MILHTILPDQVVLPEGDEVEELAKKQRFIEVEGRQVLIEPVSENEYKIVRLISSDPRDFMDSRFQPGKIVPFKPQI
ncbi:MAG TPA: YlzJ-like family protein [Bacillales bacterium]|nr:YlzJ-like family protein [Bacillales bacterium]